MTGVSATRFVAFTVSLGKRYLRDAAVFSEFAIHKGRTGNENKSIFDSFAYDPFAFLGLSPPVRPNAPDCNETLPHGLVASLLKRDRNSGMALRPRFQEWQMNTDP